ncbi:MAG: GNAT family N-acetyltransferase [Actinobacteria bacterium]|nr:GNAT family N-acetyltransferase [Actinomycetota bacterium]
MPDEVVAGLTPIFHFFGRVPTEESLDGFIRVLPAERLHAAWEDGRAVGGAGAFPFQLTVPGGRVAAAGVTTVGVLPTHRRRGLLRGMMRAQLDDIHERGEPVAYLWASEATIYGRFGYGIASLSGEMEIPRNRAAFHAPVESAGRLRLVDYEEALELVPAVYEQVALETPGMFARSRDWWEARALADPEWRRGGGGEMVRVILEEDGRTGAYALYRLHPGFEHGTSTGRVNVIEAMGVSPQAMQQIWRYLLDVDWMDRVGARLLPVDHPLFFLLAEPRRMRFTLEDALWVRLVDVGAALGARSYASDESIVLDVLDDFCPWNGGRWRLEGGTAARTEDAAELRLDVSTLGSVYLGGFTFAQLTRAGRVEQLVPDALERADRLFRTGRAPWCPEIF